MAASPHVYGQSEDIKILRNLPVERNIAPGSAAAPAPSPHASAIQASSGYRHSQPGRFCNQPDSHAWQFVRPMNRSLLLRDRKTAHAGEAPLLPATKDFDRSAPGLPAFTAIQEPNDDQGAISAVNPQRTLLYDFPQPPVEQDFLPEATSFVSATRSGGQTASE